MENLSDINYCNNLVILTSDILKKNFDAIEIDYLANRIKNGEEVNIMTKDKVVHSSKKGFEKLDEKNATKKKRLCIGIAKFYIKIAHVFAAIVTTINPTYKYNDSNGKTQVVNLMNKNKIPKNLTEILKLNEYVRLKTQTLSVV